jgi:hypothetical protein
MKTPEQLLKITEAALGKQRQDQIDFAYHSVYGPILAKATEEAAKEGKYHITVHNQESPELFIFLTQNESIVTSLGFTVKQWSPDTERPWLKPTGIRILYIGWEK